MRRNKPRPRAPAYSPGMHRPGCDPVDMRPDDFLCDFCLTAWDGQGPVVEGHQGSLICGACLRNAWTAVRATDSQPGPVRCVMCIEERSEPFWRGTARTEAVICRRCTLQAAAALKKDPDHRWSPE